MATTKKRTLSALIVLFVLTLICSLCLSVFTVNASAAPITVHVTSSTLSTSFGQTFAHDAGKTGLRLRSVKSGTEAEGTSFTVGDTMTGDFEMDFRVQSEKTYAHTASAGWSHYVTNGKQQQFFTDNMNPYLDLKEVSFKFSSNSNPDKYFVVYVRGAHPGLAFMSSAYVYVNGENLSYTYTNVAGGHVGYGLSVKDGSPYLNLAGNGSVDEFNAMPRLYGTSFSNYSAKSSGDGTAVNTTSNLIRFDVETMCVYVNAKAANNTYGTYSSTADYLVRNVATNEYVETTNEKVKLGSIAPSDFADGYNVEVIFSDMTANDYVTGTMTGLFGGDSQYPTAITNAYERYADMTIYSLNGVAFTEENVNLIDDDAMADLTLKVGANTQTVVKEKGSTVALKELVSLAEGNVVVGYKIAGKDGVYSPDYVLTIEEDTTVEAVCAYFTMIDGASIRYAFDGTSGIRFGVKMDEASKTALAALTNVKYYYSITLVGGNTVAKEVDATKIYFDEKLNAFVATAAVTNLPANMFEEKWTAQFYVTADYADATAVQTNAASKGASHSIKEIAQKIKDGDEYATLSEEKKALIDSFIGEEVQ